MQESLVSFETYSDDNANRLCDVISAFLRGGGGGGASGGGSGDSSDNVDNSGRLLPGEGD